MTDDIECPHCECLVENFVNDYSDWLYARELYSEDTEKEVECPNCKEMFFVKVYSSVVYETAKTKEDL